jgi:poly-gamma-glutamate capsule biosynthesis protein CapA/YwtB (metallophosphatase superfamily)
MELIRRWFSRNFGSYKNNLWVAEEVIKRILEDKRLVNLDSKTIDEIMMHSADIYKVTDPEYYEAFLEKWQVFKERMMQRDFESKRDKYT